MVTGLQVFNLTCALMDEMLDTGLISESDVKSYKAKAPSLLTILQTELLGIEGSATAPTIITDLTQNLAVTDKTAIQTMPYGLGAHLMIVENPDIAGYFEDKYNEFKGKIPKTEVVIEDVYGDFN